MESMLSLADTTAGARADNASSDVNNAAAQPSGSQCVASRGLLGSAACINLESPMLRHYDNSAELSIATAPRHGDAYAEDGANGAELTHSVALPVRNEEQESGGSRPGKRQRLGVTADGPAVEGPHEPHLHYQLLQDDMRMGELGDELHRMSGAVTSADGRYWGGMGDGRLRFHEISNEVARGAGSDGLDHGPVDFQDGVGRQGGGEHRHLIEREREEEEEDEMHEEAEEEEVAEGDEGGGDEEEGREEM